MIKNKQFKIEEIENFIHDHIQSKISHKELIQMGFDLRNIEVFKKEFEIYRLGLFEGICNGISMCRGKIEGIGD